MQYTKAQERAIRERGSSLLVSAGAGSGKTAVLTQRIIERICDTNDNCDITDFLIVTFTNAASGELSQRIRAKLCEKSAQDPNNKKILRNLSLLPAAKISTINAFCYELVRKNFQKLSLSPKIRMADDTEIKVIKDRLMNKVIDEAFSDEKHYDSFIMVYETFSGTKNDDAFVKILLKLDEKIKNTTSPEDFKKMLCHMYESCENSHDFFDSSYGKILKEYTKDKVSNLLEKTRLCLDMCLGDEILEKKYYDAIKNDEIMLSDILKCLESGYDKTRECVLEYTPKYLSPVRNYDDTQKLDTIKGIRTSVSETVKKVLKPIFEADGETLKKCSKDCKNIIRELLYLVEKFNNELDLYKKSKSIVEFNDVEHFALSLLVESVDPYVETDLARQMQKEFCEIYIDEYQDVNALQDLIFYALSSKEGQANTEKSRFMVGDIKQSIYRFRGARPDIFKMYRSEFDDIDSHSLRRKIFMQDNFRCAQSVIDFTNQIFSRLMGSDYLSGDALLYSRQEMSKVESKVNIDICEIDKDGMMDLSSEEFEAFMICNKIKEIVNNPDYTDSNGKMYSYSDVAVITRSKGALKIYESVFSDAGIPVVSDVGESFFGKKEIILALNILNCIDNPERDIYLAGFMRSVAGGFSDDEICVIKNQNKKQKLYLAVKKYALEGKDETLKIKCGNFVETLREFINLSRGKSASEVLWEIYARCDLLNICTSKVFDKNTTPEISLQRRANLLKLYEMSRDFTNTSFRLIGDFIDYINFSMEKNDIKAQRVSGKESVTLMSIHSSKGLEFPVCFVSDTNRGINHTDENDRFIVSYTEGVSMKLRDVKGIESQKSQTGNADIETPFRLVFRELEKTRCIEEEIRILYVALTRARDRLFITGAVKGEAKKLLEKCKMQAISKDFKQAKSFLEMVLSASLSDGGEIAGVNIFTSDECMQNYQNIIDAIQDSGSENSDDNSEIDKELLNTLEKMSEFTYRDAVLTKIPSKLTVSMLKTGLIDEEKVQSQDRDLVTVPDFMKEQVKATGAEIGTAHHLFMQFANYSCCEESCEKEADRLLQDGFIDAKQRELLDTNLLQDFFKTPFYEKIKASKNIFREQRFNILVDANEYAKNTQKGTHQVLVQGVVDLFFENDDGTYTVVDFKTDKVKSENARSVLTERHSKQLEYYCKAVEYITGKDVKNAFLYSLPHLLEIEVDI